MKKFVFGIVALLFIGVGLVVYMSTRKAPDTRNFPWNADKEHVKTQETAQLETEKPDALIYETILFDIPVALGYYFEQDQLRSVKYVSLNRYTEFKGCLQEYRNLFERLTNKHGRAKTLVEQNYRNAVWTTLHSRIFLETLSTGDGFIWVLEYQQ